MLFQTPEHVPEEQIAIEMPNVVQTNFADVRKVTKETGKLSAQVSTLILHSY